MDFLDICTVPLVSNEYDYQIHFNLLLWFPSSAFVLWLRKTVSKTSHGHLNIDFFRVLKRNINSNRLQFFRSSRLYKSPRKSFITLSTGLFQSNYRFHNLLRSAKFVLKRTKMSTCFKRMQHKFCLKPSSNTFI